MPIRPLVAVLADFLAAAFGARAVMPGVTVRRYDDFGPAKVALATNKSRQSIDENQKLN